jgi:hypothetical protein
MLDVPQLSFRAPRNAIGARVGEREQKNYDEISVNI